MQQRVHEIRARVVAVAVCLTLALFAPWFA